MIDMGFEPDVQKVLDHMPVTNQKPDSEVNTTITLKKKLFSSNIAIIFFLVISLSLISYGFSRDRFR